MEENKALVTRDESLPFKLMDALDDQLIIAELEGRMPEILTYHFSDRGQEVWGLSKAGVDEATCELSKQGEVIREIELSFIDGKDEAYFTVKAGRYAIAKNGQEVLLDTKFGTKRQPKKTAKGNDNGFWYEQGSIKACRNASMRLIPKTIVQAVIENAKSKGKVKEVEKEDSSEPKPDTKASENLTAEFIDKFEATKTLGDLKKVWDEINNVKKDLLPEHFQQLLAIKDQLKGKLK
jgi:hypothetical protein